MQVHPRARAAGIYFERDVLVFANSQELQTPWNSRVPSSSRSGDAQTAPRVLLGLTVPCPAFFWCDWSCLAPLKESNLEQMVLKTQFLGNGILLAHPKPP